MEVFEFIGHLLPGVMKISAQFFLWPYHIGMPDRVAHGFCGAMMGILVAGLAVAFPPFGAALGLSAIATIGLGFGAGFFAKEIAAVAEVTSWAWSGLSSIASSISSGLSNLLSFGKSHDKVSGLDRSNDCDDPYTYSPEAIDTSKCRSAISTIDQSELPGVKIRSTNNQTTTMRGFELEKDYDDHYQSESESDFSSKP